MERRDNAWLRNLYEKRLSVALKLTILNLNDKFRGKNKH